MIAVCKKQVWSYKKKKNKHTNKNIDIERTIYDITRGDADGDSLMLLVFCLENQWNEFKYHNSFNSNGR